MGSVQNASLNPLDSEEAVRTRSARRWRRLGSGSGLNPLDSEEAVRTIVVRMPFGRLIMSQSSR